MTVGQVLLIVFGGCFLLALAWELWRRLKGDSALECPQGHPLDGLIDGECIHCVLERKAQEFHANELESRAKICNMIWTDRAVMLGDTDFSRCRFIHCTLIDDGPFSMQGCFMDNCTIRTVPAYRENVFPNRYNRSKRWRIPRSANPPTWSVLH